MDVLGSRDGMYNRTDPRGRTSGRLADRTICPPGAPVTGEI